MSDDLIDLECARHNLMTLWSMRPPITKRMPKDLQKRIADAAKEVRALDSTDPGRHKREAERVERARADYARWQRESAEFLANRGTP